MNAELTEWMTPHLRDLTLRLWRIRKLAHMHRPGYRFNDRHTPGRYLLVTREPDRSGRWRCTYFGADHEPHGHATRDTLIECLKEAHMLGADLFTDV